MEERASLLTRKDMPPLPLSIAMWETEAQNCQSFGPVSSPSLPAKKKKDGNLYCCMKSQNI